MGSHTWPPWCPRRRSRDEREIVNVKDLPGGKARGPNEGDQGVDKAALSSHSHFPGSGRFFPTFLKRS